MRPLGSQSLNNKIEFYMSYYVIFDVFSQLKKIYQFLHLGQAPGNKVPKYSSALVCCYFDLGGFLCFKNMFL